MKYSEKRFTVPVGQINHDHPKAADLDALFPKKPKEQKPVDIPAASRDPGEWTELIRWETGLVEHVCQHGVGHPDHNSVLRLEAATGDSTWGVHGCDSCCLHETFPGRLTRR